MLKGVKNIKELQVHDNFMHCHIAGSVDSFLKSIAKQPVRSLRTRELDLEEVFLKMYGRDVPNV
jgi:hypothetical protein